MTVFAGIDVGNATTEVVLARLSRGAMEVVAAGRAPTRRAKGTPASLVGAVALVRRLERQHGVRVEQAFAAPLRPIVTGSASLAADRPVTGRLHVVTSGAATAGGAGFGAGRPVQFGDPISGDDPVVVAVPSGPRYDEVARALAQYATTGQLVGVLLEDDEAVLVANRLPVEVPVVDGVTASAVLDATRVAVEVPQDGRPLRVLTDPLKLAAALGLAPDETSDAAALASELFDATNAVVALNGNSPTGVANPTGWIDIAGQRLPFLVGQRAVREGRVGEASAYALPPDLSAHEVDDLWTMDLGAVASSVLARRSAASERPVAVAAMLAEAGWADPAAHLCALLEAPVMTAPSEAAAARAGALTTPGATATSVVVDLGGGTIDVAAVHGSAVAAGAGDLLTASVAALTGTAMAAAEWVKRGPAHRVEAPQLLLAEDGGRTFLDRPAPPGTVGSLVVKGPAGLLAFSGTMAPGEWRALRLRLKTDLIGMNIARALRSLALRPATVVVVGGPAGDDEVLAAVAGALTPGTAVARGVVAGTLGHRYAVAYGLIQLLGQPPGERAG